MSSSSSSSAAAELFFKQAEIYAESRPSYPPELFEFIASKTTTHDLVWDAGTGTGLAANSLSKIFKSVIATDTSQKQLEFAPRLPNVRYQCTPPAMTIPDELERYVAPESTVDLVIVAQALHWFDLPTFYPQVQHVLKKPHGVIAAWCYTTPLVNDAVDAIFKRVYFVDSRAYWNPGRNLVVDRYGGIDFPFEPLDGLDNTGPFRFKAEKTMDLQSYVKYTKSGSAYQTAKDQGVELLTRGTMQELEEAWNGDGNGEKLVVFPIYLRIGRVGNV